MVDKGKLLAHPMAEDPKTAPARPYPCIPGVSKSKGREFGPQINLGSVQRSPCFSKESFMANVGPLHTFPPVVFHNPLGPFK
jgi:hypothetical protein